LTFSDPQSHYPTRAYEKAPGTGIGRIVF